MKKHCIVFLGNIYTAPYLKYYLKYLDGNVDIIYWDKEGLVENVLVNKKYVFSYPVFKANKIKKILGFYKFKKYASKILKKEKYDNVIVFPTQTGILLRKTLKKRYSNNYIVDIRDYSYEHNSIYYSKLKKLLNYAKKTVISSPGFKAFLPKREYILAHNIDEKVFEENKKTTIKINRNEPIVISYIGYVRFLPQLKKYILKFKNDNRFSLKFIGKGADELKDFCKENAVKNVFLKDYFNPNETYKYYEETDIVFNLYGNNTPLLDYALSNKLYFSAIYKKPIIVCPNTYMEKLSIEYNFGIVVDLNNENAVNDLYETYNSINEEKFENGANDFINKSKEENELFIKMIKEL